MISRFKKSINSSLTNTVLPEEKKRNEATKITGQPSHKPPPQATRHTSSSGTSNEVPLHRTGSSNLKQVNPKPQQAATNKEAVASAPETLVRFDQNGKSRGFQQPANFEMHAFSAVSIEQVMQLPVNPPAKSTDLHLLIHSREWTHVRVKIKVPLEKGGSIRTALTSSKVTNAPFKSSSALQKALLQRDELGRTPLHLMLHRRSTGPISSGGGLEMKKAPPDLILAVLCSCPRAASIPDIKNNYPLHVAVMHGHRTDIVRTLVHAYPGSVQEQNEDMDTPLILAANFSLTIRFRQRNGQHEDVPQPHHNQQQQQQEEQLEVRQHVIKPFDSPEDITQASQTLLLNDQASRDAFHKSQRWELVLLLLQHRPDSACVRNRHDMSVLEMALQRHAPANVIRTLLRADKSAAAIQRRIVVASPVRSKKASAEQDSHSDYSTSIGCGNGVMTPLSLAILRDASEEILGMLSFSFPPALQIRDECGVGPVAKCWLEWYYELVAPPQSTSNGSGRKLSYTIACKTGRRTMFAWLLDTKGQELHQDLRLLWLKLQTLLCVSHHPDCVRNIHYRPPLQTLKTTRRETDSSDPNLLPILPPNNVKFRVVHAVSSQDCPIEILIIAVLLNPLEASERDEFGRIPLHLAAEAPVYVNQPYETINSAITPIERLLQVFPQGSSVADGYGRLPLHIAVRAGKKWDQGVSSLVAADCRALNTPDPVTGLYPVMTAACRYGRESAMSPFLSYVARNRTVSLKWQAMKDCERALEVSRVRMEDDLAGLATLFELLRACPGVLLSGRRRAMDQVPRSNFVDLSRAIKETSAENSDSSMEDEGRYEKEREAENLDVLYGVSDWSSSDLATCNPLTGQKLEGTMAKDWATTPQTSVLATKAASGFPDWSSHEIMGNTAMPTGANDLILNTPLIQSGVSYWSLNAASMTAQSILRVKQVGAFGGKETMNPKKVGKRVRFNLLSSSATLPSDLGKTHGKWQMKEESVETKVASGVADWSVYDIMGNTVVSKSLNDLTLNKPLIQTGVSDWSMNEAFMNRKVSIKEKDVDIFGGEETMNPKNAEDKVRFNLLSSSAAQPTTLDEAQGVSQIKEESKSKQAQSRFQRGQEALYTDPKKHISAVTIIKVHFDDQLEPYYDILLPNGTEKQTDDAHLVELEKDGNLTDNAKKIGIMTPQLNAQSRFQSGQEALYTDSNKHIIAVKILRVNFDDQLEPFYDILLPNGTEKQTDDAHLAQFETDGNISGKSNKIGILRSQANPNTVLPDTVALAMNATPFDNGKIAEESCESATSPSNPFDAFDSLSCEPSAPILMESTSAQKKSQTNATMNVFASLKTPFSLNQNRSRQDEKKHNLMSLCTQCQTNDRRTLLMPCRHLCLCPACATNIEDSKCPLCKENVETTIEVLLDYTRVLL